MLASLWCLGFHPDPMHLPPPSVQLMLVMLRMLACLILLGHVGFRSQVARLMLRMLTVVKPRRV